MKTILENGARPVDIPEQPSFRGAVRWVDWARSFSSLTIRKSHNGLRPKRSDPDSRLCQEFGDSSRHAAGKTFPKNQTGKALERGPLGNSSPPPRRAKPFGLASIPCRIPH